MAIFDFHRESGQAYFDTQTETQITLIASLFTNVNTFFSPTITLGGAGVPKNLFPSLFTNTSIFFSPTIIGGASGGTISLTPADIAAIADAVWNHPKALTVGKFLALK